ncbi:hypothetical protein Tco_0091239 [Tanacetum coccineum]
MPYTEYSCKTIYSVSTSEYTIWLFHLEIRDISILDEMAERLTSRMLMEHRDAQGHSLFTGRAWRRLFEVRGPLVFELIMKLFSTFMFSEAIVDIDVVGTLQFQLGGAKRHMSQFILALGLHTAEEMETTGFGLYWAESVRQISDKGDLTLLGGVKHLRSMDVGSVNILYLLARYLRMFASGRKRGAMIYGGQFVAHLAEHFGLLTEQRLQGLMVIVRDLPVIDMAEFVWLQICEELDDTWAWVAPGPERQPDVMAGAPEVTGGALDIAEGAQAIPGTRYRLSAAPAVVPARVYIKRWKDIVEEVLRMREGKLRSKGRLVDPIYLAAEENRKQTRETTKKRGAMIYGGQFVAHLAEHFGLLTEQRLQGLMVIVRDLPVIDMAEFVWLQICEELDDTWAWVAPGPERQPDVMAGAPEVTGGALDIAEGAQAIPAPV